MKKNALEVRGSARWLGRQLGVLTTIAVAATIMLPVAAAHAESAKYKDGSTVVAQNNDEDPTADSGLVICNPGDHSGQGGACFDYDAHPGGSWSVRPVDNSGFQLAYRVCLTAAGNTDPVPGTGGTVLEGDCDDAGNANHFSHGFTDAANEWRVPTTVVAESGGADYEWIIVFLCDAVMENFDTPGFHSHGVTTGTVTLDTTANQGGSVGFVEGGIPQPLCGGGEASTHKYRIQGVAPDPVPNPSPTDVPTLSEWGVILLVATLATAGVAVARRKA